MRNQYKVLAEKYNIICEAEDVILGRDGPFENFAYEESVYNLISVIKDWPHSKKFIDWLVNKSDTYSADITDFASQNDIESAIEAACMYFDASAENYVDGYSARSGEEEGNIEDNARDVTTRVIRKAYNYFMRDWWPKEQARLAALNKGNPGIEMDI